MTTGITATKAADTISIHVYNFSRKHGQEITLTMCEEIISEMRGGHLGGWLQGVARKANPKTVFRFAKALKTELAR